MKINPSPVEETDINLSPAGNRTTSRMELLRYGVLAGIIIIFSLVMIGQLITPFKNMDWFEIGSRFAILVIGDGLLLWIMFLYHQLAVILTKQTAQKRQLIEQKRELTTAFDLRTADLNRKLEQNRVAIEISQIINQNLDRHILLEQVVNLTQERFNLYYSGIFLVEKGGQIAVLQAGSGDAGKMMLAKHHSLDVNETSMIGWSIKNKKPRISLDVGSEAVRFKNPDLPLTRSEIALPLISHDNVMGALTLQSTFNGAFSEDDIVTLQGVADMIATALENSQLIQETSDNLKQINALHQKYLETAWNEKIIENEGIKYIYESKSAAEGIESSSTVSIPMALRGQEIGTLNLEMDGASITKEEFALVEAIINQTALALENARLLEETQKKVGLEHMLNDLTTRFSRALDVDQILRIALQELGHLSQVSEVSVYIKSPEADDLDRLSISEGNQKN